MSFIRSTLCALIFAACASLLYAQDVQVRACNVLQPEVEIDYSTPATAEPLRIAGARNGTFSGKVILSSKSPIKGVRASVSDLTGPGKIPASDVDVRYALLTAPTRGLSTAFDPLSATPPDESPVLTAQMFGRLWQAQSPAMGWALQPVWLLVNVPKDAKAGDYRGTLAVSVAEGKTFKVPVELHVAGWTLPPPQDFRTFAEVIESPESVAMWYDVPFWSDRHFALMAKSLRLMGGIGNKTAYLHLIAETNAGNAESMVRWARRPDGTLTHDLSIVERWLDLVLKEAGKPRFVCLYAWDAFLEGGRDGNDQGADVKAARAAEDGLGPPVTLVDPKSGKVETIRLPEFADRAKSQALWGPLMKDLLAALKKHGLEDAAALGMVTDAAPSKDVVEVFKATAPGVPWMRRGHMRMKDVHGEPLSLQMGPSYNRWAYNTNPPADRHYGWRGVKWQFPGWSVHFPRGFEDHNSYCRFRMLGEVNIAGSQRGFGGLGADFWPVLKDKRGRLVGSLSARYPKSSWRNLNIRTAMFWAGDDGAEMTARFQLLREGLQECEARIFIEERILDGKLKGTLADRCQSMLDARVIALKNGMGVQDSWAYGGHWSTKKSEFPEFVQGGWQERSKELFDAAAEVAKASR